MKKIDKYFDDIPQQTPPPAPNMTEAPQTAEKTKTIDDPLAQLTRLDIVYKIPGGITPEFYALDLASDVLTSGQSSRLYQKMVKEKELVTSITCGPELRRGPSLFWFTMTLRPGKDPAEVEKVLYEEIERLKNEPVTDAELQKERMAVKRDQAEQLQSTLGRATEMGEFAVFFNDPGLINTYGKTLTAVTKPQIEAVAKKYFIPTNRTVVLTVPKPKAGQEDK